MTTGKRQPPLWLDMDFGEALARFAGADPKEANENAEADASKRKLPTPEPLTPEKGNRATRRRTRPV